MLCRFLWYHFQADKGPGLWLTFVLSGKERRERTSVSLYPAFGQIEKRQRAFCFCFLIVVTSALKWQVLRCCIMPPTISTCMCCHDVKTFFSPHSPHPKTFLAVSYKEENGKLWIPIKCKKPIWAACFIVLRTGQDFIYWL